MVLIGLLNAFETIDQQILLKKIIYLGFSRSTITWFKSYLWERELKISIKTSYFSPSNLLCGVPQGSILGSLVFLLYINDLPQAVCQRLVTLCWWSCTFFQHKSEIEIEKQLIRDYPSFCDTFCTRQTKINIIGSKHKLRNAKSLNIVYNGIEIKQHGKVKYLGCIVDKGLSGETMTLNVIDKINSHLKFLHWQNRFLTPLLHRLLCDALIQSLFYYPCTAWFPKSYKETNAK